MCSGFSNLVSKFFLEFYQPHGEQSDDNANEMEDAEIVEEEVEDDEEEEEEEEEEDKEEEEEDEEEGDVHTRRLGTSTSVSQIKGFGFIFLWAGFFVTLFLFLGLVGLFLPCLLSRAFCIWRHFLRPPPPRPGAYLFLFFL